MVLTSIARTLDGALNLYPLDLATFIAWLNDGAQQGNGTAGMAYNGCFCPLAHFLQANFGGSWLVGLEKYDRLSDDLYFDIDEEHVLPAWARAFVRIVDEYGEEPLSYTDALTFLRQALVGLGLSDSGTGDELDVDAALALVPVEVTYG